MAKTKSFLVIDWRKELYSDCFSNSSTVVAKHSGQGNSSKEGFNWTQSFRGSESQVAEQKHNDSQWEQQLRVHTSQTGSRGQTGNYKAFETLSSSQLHNFSNLSESVLSTDAKVKYTVFGAILIQNTVFQYLSFID